MSDLVCAHGCLSRSCERCEDADTIAQLRAELERNDRWFREMLADYRIEYDDNEYNRRQSLNLYIHGLRSEVEQLRGERNELRDVLEWAMGCFVEECVSEYDEPEDMAIHYQMRDKARALLARLKGEKT